LWSGQLLANVLFALVYFGGKEKRKQKNF